MRFLYELPVSHLAPSETLWSCGKRERSWTRLEATRAKSPRLLRRRCCWQICLLSSSLVTFTVYNGYFPDSNLPSAQIVTGGPSQSNKPLNHHTHLIAGFNIWPWYAFPSLWLFLLLRILDILQMYLEYKALHFIFAQIISQDMPLVHTSLSIYVVLLFTTIWQWINKMKKKLQHLRETKILLSYFL